MSKSVCNELRQRLARAIGDAEVARLSPGLATSVSLEVAADRIYLDMTEGVVSLADSGDALLRLRAQPDAWAKVLQTPPPPRYHSFTAFQLANEAFELIGDAIDWARARPVLERIFELVCRSVPAAAAPVARDCGQIEGRYQRLAADGTTYDLYYETAGQGVPVLFLHTAGADSRQFMPQLADVALANDYRMIAADLPFHGKSMPADDWNGGPYKLTADTYRGWCEAIIDQIIGEPAIVVGGSMGAAMAMVLAARSAGRLLGAVAVEPPYQSRGRRNPFQNHLAVHGGLHNSSFVRGLMSPTSPESRRRAASWIYSQGAPGIYTGDLAFYSEEFDGEQVAPAIAKAGTPMAFLSGSYDYSATPADGRKLADLVPGSLFVEMNDLGHFPMCEHPDLFRSFLLHALDFVRNKRG